MEKKKGRRIYFPSWHSQFPTLSLPIRTRRQMWKKTQPCNKINTLCQHVLPVAGFNHTILEKLS